MFAVSCPSKKIFPEVGVSSWSTMFAAVDLPEPDSPTTARVVPRRRTKETSSTALRIFASPLAPRMSNSLDRCSTRMISSVEVDPMPAPVSSSSVTWTPRLCADSMRAEASDGAAETRRLV